nr:maleylpyruvate isomerase N-terminal domain-containing protein [Streptomyces sp. SID4948]
MGLIDERSAAFRAAVAAAPSLDVRVPTCPEWTLFDLVQHLGDGRRSWAATIAAGPAATAKSTVPGAPAAPRERAALLAWLAQSTEQLLSALRESGPDRGCWTWWGRSQSPQTCGAVARHQLQEIAMHTYDAQITLDAPQPLPNEVALDGVEEFLLTVCATTSAWPYEPAAVDVHVDVPADVPVDGHATEGRSWQVSLSADGARITRLATPGTPPTAVGAASDAVGASLRGTAGELVLALYGRRPVDTLKVDGDRRLLDLLWAWEPDE